MCRKFDLKVDRTLTNGPFLFDLYRQACVWVFFSYFSLDEQTIGRKTKFYLGMRE